MYFQALFLIFFSSLVIQTLFNIPFWMPAVLLTVLSFAPAFIKSMRMPVGFRAGLYREAWSDELIKAFNRLDQLSFLEGIRNVGNKASMLQDGEIVVINLTYFGATPDVLINNTTYPIPIQTLDGSNVAVQLNKFQTKATPVTDDEVVGLNYDKIREVQQSHANKLIQEKADMALDSIAPAGNIAGINGTPVLYTTGADDGTNRKRLTINDIINFRKAWTDAGYPLPARLVLCADHVNDLLLLDQTFKDRYYDYTTGKIANLFGFEVYEYRKNPYYIKTTRVKLSYGATPTSSHRQASVVFSLDRVRRASGFTKAYISESSRDPLYQRYLLNYRTYDLVTPIANQAIGAILSPDNV